jgi:hypothetical protein
VSFGDGVALVAGAFVFLLLARRFRQRQREIAARARERERARIAQDLHDHLGHDLNLIALSAGTLKLTVPADHRPAAQDVRARAAAAVERLGEVVGLLRTDLTDVPGLVDGAERAGLDVTLDAEPGIDGPVVRRVVQEALTNVVKHAPGAAAGVRLRRRADGIEVSVTNGLPGLAKRVESAGGELAYGPEVDGFTVSARIPVRPSVRRERAPRLGRLAFVTVAVPLAVTASIGVGARAWEARQMSATVLGAATYAALDVGVHRAELGLPRPVGSRGGCESYAITADPLDDRYGDTYQLCFVRDRLVSKQVSAA